MPKKNPAIIKRDTKENWLKSNYIPKENVIIIVDNPDGTISLMVGDGETNVNNLQDILLSEQVPFSKSIVNNEEILML